MNHFHIDIARGAALEFPAAASAGAACGRGHFGVTRASRLRGGNTMSTLPRRRFDAAAIPH